MVRPDVDALVGANASDSVGFEFFSDRLRHLRIELDRHELVVSSGDDVVLWIAP
jgi:hypothetical protein